MFRRNRMSLHLGACQAPAAQGEDALAAWDTGAGSNVQRAFLWELLEIWHLQTSLHTSWHLLTSLDTSWHLSPACISCCGKGQEPWSLYNLLGHTCVERGSTFAALCILLAMCLTQLQEPITYSRRWAPFVAPGEDTGGWCKNLFSYTWSSWTAWSKMHQLDYGS